MFADDTNIVLQVNFLILFEMFWIVSWMNYVIGLLLIGYQ